MVDTCRVVWLAMGVFIDDVCYHAMFDMNDHVNLDPHALKAEDPSTNATKQVDNFCSSLGLQ